MGKGTLRARPSWRMTGKVATCRIEDDLPLRQNLIANAAERVKRFVPECTDVDAADRLIIHGFAERLLSTYKSV